VQANAHQIWQNQYVWPPTTPWFSQLIFNKVNLNLILTTIIAIIQGGEILWSEKCFSPRFLSFYFSLDFSGHPCQKITYLTFTLLSSLHIELISFSHWISVSSYHLLLLATRIRLLYQVIDGIFKRHTASILEALWNMIGTSSNTTLPKHSQIVASQYGAERSSRKLRHSSNSGGD
jgi:hypothetical protein